MASSQSVEQRLQGLRAVLRRIASYPPKGHPRRTDDGYPTDFTYDEFAYQRMVDSYRNAIREALKASKA